MSTALWVTPVSNLAGVARHVLDATTGGLPGWDVVVAAPEGALLDALRDRGVAVLPTEMGEGVSTWTAVRRLRAAINKVKPQVVHSHLARADLLSAAASAGLPTKLVSTEHGIAADRTLYNANAVKATLKCALHWARCQRTDAIIGVSRSTCELVHATWRPRARVVLIPNGIDRPVERKSEPGTRFLSLSRLSHEKNIHLVLEAFGHVQASLPEATLTIAGDGPLREPLKQQAASARLQNVTFPGHVCASEALASHDVVVQLSAWENASYTLLDAAAHGLGVVATPVGGNPEFLARDCLTQAQDPTRVSNLMMNQAKDLWRRPSLPENWPTVAEMKRGIVDVYEQVWR